jgi:hypothetical protein
MPDAAFVAARKASGPRQRRRAKPDKGTAPFYGDFPASVLVQQSTTAVGGAMTSTVWFCDCGQEVARATDPFRDGDLCPFCGATYREARSYDPAAPIAALPFGSPTVDSFRVVNSYTHLSYIAAPSPASSRLLYS